MNEVKLNAKQRQYIARFLMIEEQIKDYKQVRNNYAFNLALMLLDDRGYLISDYAEAVAQFINDYRKGKR